MPKVLFNIWRTSSMGGEFQEYKTEITEGMVVLDAIHQIQAEMPTIWLYDGIAKPENVAHVPLKSTAVPN